MSHPSLMELTESVHGIEELPRHCEDCNDLVAKLEDELDVLRRAEAPARPSRLGWRIAPVAAAAVLLFCVGVILFMTPVFQDTDHNEAAPQDDTPKVSDPIDAFLNGSDKQSDIARKKLLERGTEALPALVKAKFKDREAPRAEALSELIWALKYRRVADDAVAKNILDNVEAIKLTIDMQNTPFDQVIEYIREVSGLNVSVDSRVKGDLKVDLKLKSVSIRTILEQFGVDHKLDYDVRYGVLYLASPDRLWSAPKPKAIVPLTEERKTEATRCVDCLGVDDADERSKAADALKKMGPAVIPVLEEGLKSTDAEIVARCRQLIRELTPKAGVFANLPVENAWRKQKFTREDNKAIAKKLRSMKLDMSFEAAGLSDILEFVRDFTDLNIVMKRAIELEEVTLKTKGIPLGNVFELLTLPNGLDMRIRDGILEIYQRR